MSLAKIVPSYYGYVGSTNDALLIIQAIVDKQLDAIPRRPHERERPGLIKSGNVFVFVEEESGIKRWTDGVAWSPLRILGRFLVYRELDKFSLSEKDDKKKKKRKASTDHDALDLKQMMPPAQQLLQPADGFDDYKGGAGAGALGEALGVFKDQGLIKKTLLLSLSVSTQEGKLLILARRSKPHDATGATGAAKGKRHGGDDKHTVHLISYYNADDVLNGRLQRPLVTDLKDLPISGELWSAIKELSLGGKIPIEDEAFYFLDTNYQLQNMSSLLQQQQQQQHPQQQHPGSHHGVDTPHHQGPNGDLGQHPMMPGMYVPRKYSSSQPMHLLPVPQQSQQQQHHQHPLRLQQQQHHHHQQHQQHQHPHHAPHPPQQPHEDEEHTPAMLPLPAAQSSSDLNFINPFTGTAQTPSGSMAGTTGASNSFGYRMSAGSGLPYYNTNYMNAPTQQAQQQYLHGLYMDGNMGTNNVAGYNNSTAYPQPPAFPHFPQHYQQMYQQTQPPPPQQPHGSISNSSEYSMGGTLNGLVSLIGSTVVDGSGGGSISSMLGGPPSSLGGKKARTGHNNWFTTASGANQIPGGYVAPPPPVSLPMAPDAHHHPHHLSGTDDQKNQPYVANPGYSNAA